MKVFVSGINRRLCLFLCNWL